jgi:hypothetical protein
MANGFGFHNEAALLLQLQSVEPIRVSIRHAQDLHIGITDGITDG